jgi:hypothetical protein
MTIVENRVNLLRDELAQRVKRITKKPTRTSESRVLVNMDEINHQQLEDLLDGPGQVSIKRSGSGILITVDALK